MNRMFPELSHNQGKMFLNIKKWMFREHSEIMFLLLNRNVCQIYFCELGRNQVQVRRDSLGHLDALFYRFVYPYCLLDFFMPGKTILERKFGLILCFSCDEG